MIANHLSRLEKIVEKVKETKIAENFLNEKLFLLAVQTPWYVDIVNYLSYGVVPPEFMLLAEKKIEN